MQLSHLIYSCVATLAIAPVSTFAWQDPSVLIVTGNRIMMRCSRAPFTGSHKLNGTVDLATRIVRLRLRASRAKIFMPITRAPPSMLWKPRRRQPVSARFVLGGFVGAKNDTSLTGFRELPGYPVTRVRSGGPHFLFDPTQPLDDTGRLDDHIVANWLIAAHESQGTMQLLMNTGGVERYWFLASNDDRGFAVEDLFHRLNTPDF